MMPKSKKKKKLSLMEAFPSLAKEWHPTKNDILTPEDVAPGDFIHAWWICHRKHEWIAVVSDRVAGAGCPFCPSISPQYPGMITLADAQPEAIEYWHPEKNGNRTPDQFAEKSNIKVWWKCEKGHEWYAAIVSMRPKLRCPYCYPSAYTSRNYNLAVKRPEIARQWHPTKNAPLLPTQVSPGSNKKVWWKCDKGHEWLSTVAARQETVGCPYCSTKKRKLSSTYNLAVIAPHVVPFWHPTKNGDLTPADIIPTTTEKVWWVCENGHGWQRAVSYMQISQKCPVCRRLFINDTNVLGIQNPELAREWHPSKNGDLTPYKIRPHSLEKVWWICPKGHEYHASVANRNRPGGKGRGCPYCYGRKILSKESLAILFPELAKEWHQEKNGDLTPEKVSTVNNRNVWWKCKNGHQWQVSVKKRVHEKKWHSCPYCKG